MNMHERLGLHFEDLEIGMEAYYSKIVTEEDIQAFSILSGDNNPVHLDDNYASNTIFKKRIAHGILTASFISTVCGTKLPGPGAIYVSQSLNFRAPVHIGDEVVAKATVKDLVEDRKRAVLSCDCTVNGKTVLDGEAVLMVPSRN